MQTDPISAAKAYQQVLRQIANARTLHEARALAIEVSKVTFTPPTETEVSVGNGYGLVTKQPFVVLGMANPAETANPTIQIGTTQARALAFQILEAADAAESDGFLVEFLQHAAQLGPEQLGALLSEFRQWRDQRRQKGDTR